jgi:hypothetical protein
MYRCLGFMGIASPVPIYTCHVPLGLASRVSCRYTSLFPRSGLAVKDKPSLQLTLVFPLRVKAILGLP